MKTITVSELKEKRDNNEDVFVLDVREDHEFDEAHLDPDLHVPMADIPNHLDQIPKDKPVVVHCRSGKRSATITKYLGDQGYDNVYNLEGGLLAWMKEHGIDPNVIL